MRPRVATHGGSNPDTQQLDGLQDLGIGHRADAHLHQEALMPENRVLGQDLLNSMISRVGTDIHAWNGPAHPHVGLVGYMSIDSPAVVAHASSHRHGELAVWAHFVCIWS